jgi:hypothetical protein
MSRREMTNHLAEEVKLTAVRSELTGNRTNAAGFDFDPDLWEKRPGWDRFELQIGGSILNDGGHAIFAHNWGWGG